MKTNKPRTKGKRRAALASALLLIILLVAAYDAVNGDPVSEAWATHRAIQYAEKLYPGQTFHRDMSTGTGGQFFTYMVYVQSDQSEDTWFMVQTKFWLFTTDAIKGLHTVPEPYILCRTALEDSNPYGYRGRRTGIGLSGGAGSADQSGKCLWQKQRHRIH